nr:ribose-phosphate pyrophosphokinase [uncultured Dongia sp.]
MNGPVIIALPGNEKIAAQLAIELGGTPGELETRQFPDEETYLRVATDVSGRTVIAVCTLDRPDAKFLRLMFTLATARDLGARSVGLVAPYLSYMRQDKRFHDGETITSRNFAGLLSRECDWLVTVDPHLHRYASLDEIYSVPSGVAQSAPLLADWIGKSVERPIIIGPDMESEQWVRAVAANAQIPYVVLEKTRFGDRKISIEMPDMTQWNDRTPVLIDDIISSAQTMIETCQHLIGRGLPKPVCLAVHALLSNDAYQSLREITSTIVTTNTVVHETNRIDVSAVISAEVSKLIDL